MSGNIALEKIDELADQLIATATNIWQNPEGPFQEHQAVGGLAECLRQAGFDVEIGAYGVPTAIKASWGSGSPTIGILGEYDALPSLSQQATSYKAPVLEGGYGHGCGHNLLGVAGAGGAIGLKAEMAARGLPGRVIYLGCPAEEVLVGKGFMARGGAFTDLDCVVDFHPASTNVVSMGRSTAVYSANFHFKGITAHAAFDPQNGRSALDAVELMNVGANYLREHITSDVRLHYIITEGGVAPNIVPDRASSRYFVRAFTMDACKSVYDRLVKVARGAAMMTETELEIEYLGGCYERQPIAALAELLQAALSEAPRPVWDAADRELAAALNNTMPELTASIIATNNLPADSVLHDGVLPISYTDMFASTDVGDVQHIVPGASFTTATMNLGAPGHSWQTAACSGSAIGMKGMLYAAKTFALFGLKVLENPEVLAAAQADFQQKMQGKTYDCPVTPEMTVPGI